jgi:hypothetical protein|tara:strand:- start:158 stop:298 length:141 start_codon:yes stop_codon:yes gene_type:complete
MYVKAINRKHRNAISKFKNRIALDMLAKTDYNKLKKVRKKLNETKN